MKYPHFISGPGKPKRLLLFIVPAALVLSVSFAVIFSAREALTHARGTAASNGELPFTLRLLDTSANLAQSRGFEPVASTPAYFTGTFFGGDLYLGGHSGLTVIHGTGASSSNLRLGYELPIAAIDGIAVGRLHGAGEPHVLLATRGAGLLILEAKGREQQPGKPQPGEANPNKSLTIHQLLPANAEARDLTAVLPLATGDVLLGTRHRGVLIYNGATLLPLRFTYPGIDPASLQVTALAAVDSSSYLIGTRNSGVFYLHAGVVDHADSKVGLPDDQVESIAVSLGTPTARVFVGTPVGTAEFDLAAPLFRPTRVIAEGLFSHALVLEEHQLDIGTLDQGVQQIPLEDGPRLHRTSISAGPAAPSSQRVDAFLPSSDALYALIDGALVRRTGTGWTPALPSSSTALTDANISALAFAPDGTLYIGFFDHGIDLLSPEGAVRHLEDDHLFCINRLALDPERHTMAAATANGLVLFDARGVPRQTLTRKDGLISDHVTDVIYTKTGSALATPAGITFLGSSGPESLYAFQGLVSNHVYALASNSFSGQLLAGTLGGISILKASAVERSFTAANSSLKHNWVTALLPMPDKTMLVGTYGAGLQALDSQDRFTSVELPAGIPRDLVINPNALFQTASHVYAGTLDHGMLVYSVSAGRWFAISGGLPSLDVTAFASRDGEIYVGTENGLVRMREADLP